MRKFIDVYVVVVVLGQVCASHHTNVCKKKKKKKKKKLKIKVLKKFSYWLLAAVMVSSSNIHAVETKGNRGYAL